MVVEQLFSDMDALTGQLTDELVSDLQVEAHAEPPLVYLSGGETPRRLYESLGQSSLDFARVQWALVDERWVDEYHEASNARVIQSCFRHAGGFSLVSMKNRHPDPESGLYEATERYADLPESAAICVLGMGLDGHTASWFPEACGLEKALDPLNPNPLAAIRAKPSSVTGRYTERMTLTLSRVMASGRIIVLLTGEPKYRVFKKAMKKDEHLQTPISALLSQKNCNIHLYWCP